MQDKILHVPVLAATVLLSVQDSQGKEMCPFSPEAAENTAEEHIKWLISEN